MSAQLDTFLAAGFTFIDPPVLQPADPFLDLSGEDIRRRIYVFADPAGRELCLRPDLTIPTCLAWLEAGATGEARFAYEGLAFRFQERGATRPNEFMQSGVEVIDGPATPEADAELFALTVSAVRNTGIADFDLTLGDTGLFESFVGALDMPDHWRARLRHAFAQPSRFGALLRSLTKERPRLGGTAAMIGDQDETAALETVSGLLDIAGLTEVPGRSPEAVARRLMEKARDAAAEPLAREIIDAIGTYLALEGAPPAVFDKIEALGKKVGADMVGALAPARERWALMKQAAGDTPVRFATEFGRSFDYYTGFIFEVVSGGEQIAGGGRYDDLLERLGAPRPVSAVGAMIRNDRIWDLTGGEGQ